MGPRVIVSTPKSLAQCETSAIKETDKMFWTIRERQCEYNRGHHLAAV